jgi:hypothetical protein
MPGMLPEVRTFRLDSQHEAGLCYEQGELPAPRRPEPEPRRVAKPGLMAMRRAATGRATS